ncbi:MAG: hypothetical protein LBB53_01295 [Prevotellaceae bacterium]|jgi:hypothetical protein|nr:hypothetical protein [Prevotellaceae bacterium]
MKLSDRSQVKEWLESGADLDKGLFLFLKLCKKTSAYRIVRSHPEANRVIAVRMLLRAYGADGKCVVVFKSKPFEPVCLTSKTAASFSKAETVSTQKFREMFPFLDEPNTPAELKILAADKITAYRKYTSAYSRLNDCTSIEECYLSAKEVVENYLEDRLITSEFKYYIETKKILGKHCIFDVYKNLQSIRRKSAKEIFNEQKKIINRINRIKYEINKGDKPHKLTEREQSLRKNEVYLSEINRIIDGL